MIVIDHTIISEKIRDIRFCCDLDKCLGTCCVEGDAGKYFIIGNNTNCSRLKIAPKVRSLEFGF
jgi:hypothetical protein